MTNYHRMSIAQKRAENISSVREPAVTCRDCGTQVMPVDLLLHLEQRCPGPRQPHARARWITWREALIEVRRYGVSQKALWGWVNRRVVRSRGDRGDRRYLHRDLVDEIARLVIIRRR